MSTLQVQGAYRQIEDYIERHCRFRAVLIEKVEALVEEEYARVEADLKDEWFAQLRDVLATDVETFPTSPAGGTHPPCRLQS